jgi:tRNA threonylcarbamoyladenosine biosynthesis protein TsaB
MLILTIRTDKPEAEIGLFNGDDKLGYIAWEAHRQLAETIHLKIKELLEGQNQALKDLRAVVVFQGPGSFTGLRIGISVANTLADSLKIPIVATNGDKWITGGIDRLQSGKDDKIAVPEYGGPVKTTEPRK